MRAYAVVDAGDPRMADIEVPTPEVRGREVLLRVLRSGVCHSDVHLRTGFHDLGSRGHVSLADRGLTYPLVLGHEIAGMVVAAGPEATAIQVGDVRLVYPWIGCGRCRPCRAGADDLCSRPQTIGANRSGGYAEMVVVPDERYLVPVNGLDLSYAASLACSGLTAFGATAKVAHLPADSPIVVIGTGGVGLNVVSILRLRGFERICAVDTDQTNLELAAQVGATHLVHARGDGDAAKIHKALGSPADAVIDLVNNRATVSAGFDALTKGGLLVLVGLFGGDLSLPAVMVPLKAVTLAGSYVGSLADLTDLVALAQRGQLQSAPLLEGTLSLSGVESSLDRLERGGVPGRIVLSAPES